MITAIVLAGAIFGLMCLWAAFCKPRKQVRTIHYQPRMAGKWSQLESEWPTTFPPLKSRSELYHPNRDYAVVSPQMAREIERHNQLDGGMIGNIRGMPVFTSPFVKKGGFIVSEKPVISREKAEEIHKRLRRWTDLLFWNGDDTG